MTDSANRTAQAQTQGYGTPQDPAELAALVAQAKAINALMDKQATPHSEALIRAELYS